jgi:hypothetical protein
MAAMRMHRRFGLTLTLLGALGAAATASAEGPLAIHAPPLLVPDATAGLGLAPEAAVKIAIDERGAVTKVDVVSITPSSEHDSLFRDELVKTISKWRFAPATEGGKPVPSTLDWRVRFPAKPQQVTFSLDVAAPLAGNDAESRRSAVLALPSHQRLRLLTAQTNIALALLDAKHTVEASSPRFVVHSDADDRTVAATVAGNMEAVFNVLAEELLPGISLQSEAYKLQVVVYQDRARYQALTQRMPIFEQSPGFYSPAGLIAFHLQQPTTEYLNSLILHETTHAFMDRHMVRPGVALPRWLGEGFADYVGNSRIRDGRIEPGKTLRRTLEMNVGGVFAVQTVAGGQLEGAKRALRQGAGLGVRTMLEASPEIFYCKERSLYYASSWLLVHYLRDGGEGWAQQRFPQLLLYLAEGYPPMAAFRSVYGSVETADGAFRQYVKTF